MSFRKSELYVLFATLFLALGSFSIIFPLLPDLLLQFGASSLQMGLMVTVQALFQFLFAPVWGSLSDRYGRKPILLAGLSGFAISFILMGLARDYWTLLAARSMGGILSAATFPTAQAYVADVTTPQQRGAAMASMGAAVSMGFIMGPVMGGSLGLLGIQTAFFISGAAVALTGVTAAIWLREPERQRGRPGGTTAAGGMGGLKAIRFAVASPYRLFFYLAFIVTFCGSMLFGMAGYYLHEKVDGTFVETTILFVTLGVASAILQGLVVGRVMARIGDEWTIVIGAVAGLLGFTTLVLSSTLVQILMATALTTAAMSFIRPTISSAVSKRTTLEQGMTMGIQSAFDSLGRVLGPMLAGAIFNYHYDAPFLLSAVIYLGTLVVVVRTFAAGPYGMALQGAEGEGKPGQEGSGGTPLTAAGSAQALENSLHTPGKN